MIKICHNCGREYDKVNFKYCSNDCHRIGGLRQNWPDLLRLQELLWKFEFRKDGKAKLQRDYNLSDRTLENILVQHELIKSQTNTCIYSLPKEKTYKDYLKAAGITLKKAKDIARHTLADGIFQ